MGDPRNPARVDEQWPARRIEIVRLEIETFLADLGALSGGWAWHYCSPPHDEYKDLHDHKDVDMFVEPRRSAEVIAALKSQGYGRVWTKYDDPSGQFLRFERHVEGVKVQIDLFIEDVPTRTVGPVTIVEPRTLLTYYDRKQHTTDDCRAVQAARRLLTFGQDPVGRPEMIKIDDMRHQR